MSYGEFIREQRVKSGYKSQRKLADKSGISSATISRIESEIQKPEVETLRDLSKYLTSTTFKELMNICGYGEDDNSFGEYLKKIRTEKKLSTRDIQKKTGISNSYISLIESGKKGTPSPDVLKKLYKVLNVSYEELMHVAGYITTVRKNTVNDWESFGLEMEQRGIDPDKLMDLLESVDRFSQSKI